MVVSKLCCVQQHECFSSAPRYMFQHVACGKIKTYIHIKYGALQVCNMFCLKSQGTILGLNLKEIFSLQCPGVCSRILSCQ